MKYDETILEEELKNKVAADLFNKYDCTNILGKIDFSVCIKDTLPTLFDTEYLVWGEAKRGKVKDVKTSFVQLILTIGRERPFDKYLPPKFLCEFDSTQISFLPYNTIIEIFYINDFNWNVPASDHGTKEFKQLYLLVEKTLESGSYQFSFEKDEKFLKQFLKENLVFSTGISKARITKNNFITIYNRWTEDVLPTIALDWETLNKEGILNADFYLADIMSRDNMPIMQKLQVLLLKDQYQFYGHKDRFGAFSSSKVKFSDGGKAHRKFWLRYERPPKTEYIEYIVGRRDLLVPQDIRERRGSYFTPRKWVELSQIYLANTFGENWQDEYYIWDCCGGTGNLEIGLTDKYRIYVSTLEKSDVDVINERIEKGANLLHEHVFQFDFLNDGFETGADFGFVDRLSNSKKIPQSLKDILSDPQKRCKLIIYINPPYAETAKDKKQDKSRKNKRGVSFTNVRKVYSQQIGIASKELFVQFLTRCYFSIPGCKIANFSTLKHIQGPNFDRFRNVFRASYKRGFIVPANTFDNVKGTFPIGFLIWDTEIPSPFSDITCDVYDRNSVLEGRKQLHVNEKGKFITDWFRLFHNRTVSDDNIAAIGLYGSDFQHSNDIYLTNPEKHPNRYTFVNAQNIREAATYLAVRHCEKGTWKNDRDQFLYPNDSYATDELFLNDCLVWSIFESNTYVSTNRGNCWIPYAEKEVGAKERFKSHFLNDYIQGKTKKTESPNLFSQDNKKNIPLVMSPEANAVLLAGREIWKYYHSQPKAKPDASFYEIKGFFQGFKKGKMNNTSPDDTYNSLLDNLRDTLRELTENIRKKAYKHRFLI